MKISLIIKKFEHEVHCHKNIKQCMLNILNIFIAFFKSLVDIYIAYLNNYHLAMENKAKCNFKIKNFERSTNMIQYCVPKFYCVLFNAQIKL